MLRIKRIKRWEMALGAGVLLLLCVPFLNYLGAVSEGKLYFSKPQFFYSQEIQVHLWGRWGSEIYYTINGGEPTRESACYEEPITITMPESGVHAVTIRAVEYFRDGTVGEEYVHTYFVGKDVFSRYQSLVTVVTTDPNNLYDYETGIFVEGKLRDEWITENPDGFLKPSRPANYNMRGREAEREAYLEIFEPDGKRVIAQKVGIRTNGGVSRASDKKSLKIYARKEYGDSELHYEFFPRSRTFIEGKTSDEYKRLVLRNTLGIENIAMMEMLRDVSILDIQEYRAFCGYLNGEYYFSGWLMETYDKNYFNSNYGTTEEMGTWGTVADYNEKVLDGPQMQEAVLDETEKLAIEDKENFYDVFRQKDFQDEAVFQEFCRIVDVENMLWYFAAEIYMGNMDWPYNNIKMYRWYSDQEEYGENLRTDGKWRYLSYDLDGGFAESYDVRLLNHVYDMNEESERYHIIFAKLMQREDMKTRFTEIVQELSETAFEPEHACAVIEEAVQFSRAELSAAMLEENADVPAIMEQLQELERSRESMLDFARKRPEEIKRQLEELL